MPWMSASPSSLEPGKDHVLIDATAQSISSRVSFIASFPSCWRHGVARRAARSLLPRPHRLVGGDGRRWVPASPRRVERLERLARERAGRLAVARLDELDHRPVEGHRRRGVVVEGGLQGGVLVRPARERVEKELEADVPRGVADRAHEREVRAGEGERIVHDARSAPARTLRSRRRRGPCGALGREGDGLRRQDPAQLEGAAHQLVPRRIGQLELP